MRKESGVITVFLSISLLLILSFFFTIIEGARIYVAKEYGERALSTAMNSLTAEYYGPLWKEYHIFGLDGSYGGENIDRNTMSNRIEEYMSYTFYPDQNLSLVSEVNTVDFFGISIDSLSVEGMTLLTDYQGELFLDQAVQYMKYKEVGNGLESLLDNMSLMESTGKVSILYEEKLKVEEELVDIDRGILALMELLDGVKTSKRGLETDKDGSIKTAGHFIKQIVIAEGTKEALAINNDLIFDGLKDSYWYPKEDFNEIEEAFIEIEEIDSQISLILQSSVLEGEHEYTEDLLKELGSQRNELLSQIKSKGKAIQNRIDRIIPLFDKANKEIDKILAKATIAAPLLESFEKRLEDEKDELNQTIKKGLEESLKELQRYCSTSTDENSLLEMKDILNNNKDILGNTFTNLEAAHDSLFSNNLNKARSNYKSGLSALVNYQIGGLRLDYSSFVVRDKEKSKILDKVNNSILGGITSLVIDPSNISDKKISKEDRPSDNYVLATDEIDPFIDFGNLLKNSNGSSNSELSQFFGEVGNSFKGGSNLSEGINSFAKKLLFNEYIREHFYTFPIEEDVLVERKPSALDYEQEYMLAGNTSDKENINNVISKLLMIRMLGNLPSILSNKSILSEAKAAAVAIVGFTGLPILLSITQGLIILLWTFAEALVDICALLKGKDLPLIKRSIEIRIEDLLILNRQLIEQKAERLGKEDGVTMAYDGYISMLLLTKKEEDVIFRSLDLMEVNLSMRYDNEFSFKNCIYGLKTEATITVPAKLTSFKFIRDILAINGDGFQYDIVSSYSY